MLYTTVDDGRVLRHERRPDGTWGTETIYLGPIGPRGLVAGRFHADPSLESVALFGYSGRVEVLSRAPGKPWTAEVVYRDADKGHFLATCEVDGRNATDEILACGFGGRIVVISRPPGCGKDALATSED